MRFLVVILSCLLFQVKTLEATTFLPLPIERQVAESSLVVEASYIGKEYKKINDLVMTEFYFSVKRFSGNGDGVTDWSRLKVLSPGGVWEGIVYHTFGTPRFDENETYVLLLKKNEIGHGFLNLSLGKYDLHNINGQRYLSSSVFSEHPALGKITEVRFEKILSERFQEGFQVVYTKTKNGEKTLFAKKENINERKPASYNGRTSEEDRSVDSTLSVFWLILILGLLGSFVTLKFRN